MEVADPIAKCRSCGHGLVDRVIDLGPQPDPDRLLVPDDDREAPVAAVDAWICRSCFLLQLVGDRPTGGAPVHGHGPSYDPSDDAWVSAITREVSNDSEPLAVDVDVGDDRLLRAFGACGFRTIGLTGGVADIQAVVKSRERAAVVIANHALAHAEDPDEMVGAIAGLLSDSGSVLVDFHYALAVADGQFDVFSHAHRSYFSLASMSALLQRHDLVVRDAWLVATYGGSVRLIARRAPTHPSARVAQIRAYEIERRLHAAEGFAGLRDVVDRVTGDLRRFLIEAKAAGRIVAGYGAPARGTVLLNLSGIGTDVLPFTVDRAKAKQGRLLPGARIPVLAPDEIDRTKPDDVLILPWPLADQIVEQLISARDWGARFVVAMPSLSIR